MRKFLLLKWKLLCSRFIGSLFKMDWTFEWSQDPILLIFIYICIVLCFLFFLWRHFHEKKNQIPKIPFFILLGLLFLMDGDVTAVNSADNDFIEIPYSEEGAGPTPTEEGDLWGGLEPLPEASYLPQEEERPPEPLPEASALPQEEERPPEPLPEASALPQEEERPPEPLPEASALPQEEERPPAGPPLDPEDREQPSSSVDPTLHSSRDLEEAGERGEASEPTGLWEGANRETSPTTGPLWRGNAPVLVEVYSSPEETPAEGLPLDPAVIEVPSSPEETPTTVQGDPAVIEVPSSPEASPSTGPLLDPADGGQPSSAGVAGSSEAGVAKRKRPYLNMKEDPSFILFDEITEQRSPGLEWSRLN
jgi:hypothetical protein